MNFNSLHFPITTVSHQHLAGKVPRKIHLQIRHLTTLSPIELQAEYGDELQNLGLPW